MINRFKNAIYGTSNASDDARIDYDNQETVIGKKIRSALTRSSSFREEIIGNTRIGRNNRDYYGITKSRSGAIVDKSNQKGSNPESSNLSRSILEGGHDPRHIFKEGVLPKYHYTRPTFLHLDTEDEIIVSADHDVRPIILSRDNDRVPWNAGYAECINAGKSARNEDQASCRQEIMISECNFLDSSSDLGKILPVTKIPYVYFGMFDGHAGTAVATAAANELHDIIHRRLTSIVQYLVVLELEVLESADRNDNIYCKLNSFLESSTLTNGTTNAEFKSKGENIVKEDKDNYDEKDAKDEHSNEAISETDTQSQKKSTLDKTRHASPNEQIPIENSSVSETTPQSMTQAPEEETVSRDQHTFSMASHLNMLLREECRLGNHNVTADSLITGALEASFWEMDGRIAQDKHDYVMRGGCTAVVGLFILGKLYVCNAGDSRAIVYKNSQVIPMSFDFTPVSERDRIQRLGLRRPELMGNEFTQLEFMTRPRRKDLGKQMFYRDAFMTGWSLKTITYDDLKYPLVTGDGKRSRVLATMGVTRGFGDHELKSSLGSVPIKPFLTPEPEVRILPLEDDDTLTNEDVLIIATDGLWDVTSNEEAGNVVKKSFEMFPDNEGCRSRYRYLMAAQDLVIRARGNSAHDNGFWRMDDGQVASLDDISVFVIPLKQYRDEYLEWKKQFKVEPSERALEIQPDALINGTDEIVTN